MADLVPIPFSLQSYGIDQTVTLNVPPLINGKGPEEFPRNTKEVEAIERIVGKLAGSGISEQITGVEQLVKDRIDKINDPLGYTMLKAKEKAMQPDAPGLMTAVGEFGDILPGGEPFEPGKIGEGLKNYGIRMFAGDDPKSRTTDIAAMGADVAAAGLLYESGIPNGNRNLRLTQSILNNLKKSKTKAGLAILGAGAIGKGAGNEVYELINDSMRFFQGLPDPDAAVENDQQLRELLDMRNELLFSGGAMGLQHIWPYIKPFLGKRVFGVGGDEAKKLAKMGEDQNIPMNVYSVTKSGFVTGTGRVVGLFPFVATGAKQAQNIQRVAIAENINKTLNDLSPISLFSESGLLANKEFKKMVTKFAGTKTLLYQRAMAIGDKINEPFIPTKRLKDQAMAIQEFVYGPKGLAGAADEGALLISDPRGYGNQNFDEIIGKFTGNAEEFRTAIMSLAGLKDEYITARQFSKLQRQLNDLKKFAAAEKSLGVDMGGVDDMTKTMIEILNDVDAYKVLNDPAKDALKKEYGAGMLLANDFFFGNFDKLKGRTSQILKMADKNITKATGDVEPGFYTPDMLTKILMNDDTVMAPLAIKEMQEVLGKDAVNALARSYLNDQVQSSISYVSGKIPIKGDPSLRGKITSFITGDPAKQTVKKVDFNVPIIDVKKMEEVFGITNPNRVESLKQIFGEQAYKDLKETLELAKQVEQVDFGNVSEFVKRRGFLGGVNAVANIATGGMIAANPFQNVGLMMLTRYGMSKMGDPKFLKSLQTVMNPELSTLAKNNAMLRLGSMLFDNEKNNQNVPPEIIENYDPTNPVDVMKLMIFASNNDVGYPGSEQMILDVNDDGKITDVEISKATDKNVFSMGADGAIENINEVASTQVDIPTGDLPTTSQDPFLDVDFDNMNQAIAASGVGMGENAPSDLNEAQRIALAGNNLDEAIALGNRRV
tara:strand:+ start:5263 stop:8091 length:2829 start_codon:yes stop_codon:yes gene_type:complete